MSRVFLILGVSSALVACTSFGSEAVDPPSDASTSPNDAGTDGVVSDAGEATPDASADVTSDAGAGDAGPCEGEIDCPRLVFVTSESYTGEDLGGAISADQKCTRRAESPLALPAIRARRWQAWISDDGANRTASARLTHGTRPYRLPTGALVANDWVQLTSAALLHAIDRDETGVQVGQEYVWTGTLTSGQASSATCSNWSLGGADNKGTAGLAHRSDSVWTNAGLMPCGSGYRLYCFEK